MTIGIDDLSRDELMALNRRIVERLKILDELEAIQLKMRLRPGARVSVETRDGYEPGTLMKINPKTVIVHTDSGEQWKVYPHHIRELKDVGPE